MVALLTPGSMVASRWIVGGLLGQSDRAQVYEAEEASQGRFAALKILAPALGEGVAWGEFVSITKKLSEVPGDGIARAYDIGKDTVIERPYVASERLVFPTLSRYVTERGPIPLRSLAQALETLSTALDSAHAAGILHGGLKPQNVFISVDNPHWARITDFSLGKLRADTGAGPGSLLGWSAPEASAGRPSPASDRYSLGLLCFFAATGMPWYTALRGGEGEASRASRLASERAKSFGGELDTAFDGWFERALAQDPGARFASAAEMSDSFTRLFSGSVRPPPTSAVHPFAATRPIPLAEQPTVPVKQYAPDSGPELRIVSDSTPPPGSAHPSSIPPTHPGSTPPPRPSSTPPATADGSLRPSSVQPTLPLRSSHAPPSASTPREPESGASPFVMKILVAVAAGSVALAVWWWLG